MESKSHLLPVNPQVMEPSLNQTPEMMKAIASIPLPKENLSHQVKTHPWPKAVWTFQPNPEDPQDRTTSNPETWPSLDRCLYMCNTQQDQINDLQKKLKDQETNFGRKLEEMDIQFHNERLRHAENKKSQQDATHLLETRISILEKYKECHCNSLCEAYNELKSEYHDRLLGLEKGDRPFTEFGQLFDRVADLEMEQKKIEKRTQRHSLHLERVDDFIDTQHSGDLPD